MQTECTLTPEQLDIIYTTIALLNSMVYSGEDHSEFSKQQVRDSLNLLRNQQ